MLPAKDNKFLSAYLCLLFYISRSIKRQKFSSRTNHTFFGHLPTGLGAMMIFFQNENEVFKLCPTFLFEK